MSVSCVLVVGALGIFGSVSAFVYISVNGQGYVFLSQWMVRGIQLIR